VLNEKHPRLTFRLRSRWRRTFVLTGCRLHLEPKCLP